MDTNKEWKHFYNIIFGVSQFEQSEEVKTNWRQQLPIQLSSGYSLHIVNDEETERSHSQFQFKSVTNLVILIDNEWIGDWQIQRRTWAITESQSQTNAKAKIPKHWDYSTIAEAKQVASDEGCNELNSWFFSTFFQ